MRATAQDPDAARLMGINVDRTIALTFLLGGLMAGAAGMIYALYNGTIQFNQGFTAGLIAFTAAVMGGIGNLKGAVVGGLIIGVIQSITRHPLRPGLDAGGRVRDPDPDHGLQARRACSARRRERDEHRSPPRCARTAANVRRLLPNWAGSLIFLALALLYPFILDSLVGSNSGLLDASIQTLAYIIMALGLNIVVGFAGLLDLGYVAFFAIGAFVDGLARLPAVPDVNGGKGIHILTPAKSAFGTALPGIHINFFIVIFIAAAFTAMWGVILGAPTLRLRGDYLAIVTLAFGEIVPRVFENSHERHLRHRLDRLLQRPPGHHADRQDQPALDATRPSTTRCELKPFYFVGAGDGAAGAVRQHPPARLAPGPRVDRRARGRGRRRGDGRQPRARRSSGPTRSARRSAASPACSSAPTTTPSTSTSSSSASRSSSCRWSSSAAWATSGASSSARSRCRCSTASCCPQLNGVPDKIGLDFDVTSINFGIFGFFLLVMMVLRPEGFIPSRRRKLELHADESQDSELPQDLEDQHQHVEARRT